MANTYFNTTNVKGEQLTAFTESTAAQNVLVYNCFAKYGPMAPSKVHETLIKDKLINISTPLTSIRRSITVLTDAGKLEKTADKVKSIYGRPEYIWQLVKK